MEYKEAFERIKTYCNSDNGYPYNQYVQSCDPRNEDLEVIEKALEDYSDIKNRMPIELPCKADNISEIIVAYRDYGNPLYAIVRYYCQQNKPYKILQYSIVGKELISGKDKRVWEWYPSMNFSLIEDGFTSKEQATARLKELQEKEN